MLDQYIQDLKNWAAKPYREEGSLFDWFLFTGVLIVSTWLWSKVIKQLID